MPSYFERTVPGWGQMSPWQRMGQLPEVLIGRPLEAMSNMLAPAADAWNQATAPAGQQELQAAQTMAQNAQGFRPPDLATLEAMLSGPPQAPAQDAVGDLQRQAASVGVRQPMALQYMLPGINRPAPPVGMPPSGVLPGMSPDFGQPTQWDRAPTGGPMPLRGMPENPERAAIDQAQAGRADDLARRQAQLAAMQQPGGLRYSDPQATDPTLPPRTVQAGRIQPTEQETIDKLAAIEGRMNTQMAMPENMRQEQSLDRTGLGDRMARLAAMTSEAPVAPGVKPAQGDEAAAFANERDFRANRPVTPQMEAAAADKAQRQERVKNRGIMRGLESAYGMNPAQAMALGQLEHNGQTGVPEGFGGGGGGMGLPQMFALDPSGRMAQMGIAQQGIQSEDARAQAELRMREMLGLEAVDARRDESAARREDAAAALAAMQAQHGERMTAEGQRHEQSMAAQNAQLEALKAQIAAQQAANEYARDPSNPANQQAAAQAGAVTAQTDAMRGQQAYNGPPGLDERSATLWRQSQMTGLKPAQLEALAGMVSNSAAWDPGWLNFGDEREAFKQYASKQLGITPEQVELWLATSGNAP